MDTLKRELHASTASLSSLLTRFSKLAAKASTTYGASGHGLSPDVQAERDELDSLIAQALNSFSAQVDQLADMHATAHPPPSTSAVHALERHRDVLAEYQRDYTRIKSSLREAEQRANLLGSVRQEISAFKTANSSTTDALLSERAGIDRSTRMTDDLLGQAYETRAEFARQRSNIARINSRMSNVVSQVPALNSLIGMISTRKRRDQFILGSVIGVCVVTLLWWVFGP